MLPTALPTHDVDVAFAQCPLKLFDFLSCFCFFSFLRFDFRAGASEGGRLGEGRGEGRVEGYPTLR